MEIHEYLMHLRKEKGISVYKLSHLTGLSQNHIHSIERGTTQPSVGTLKKILDELGCSLSEFFNQDAEVLYPTELERELITKARSLSQPQLYALLQLLDSFQSAKNVEEEEEGTEAD